MDERILRLPEVQEKTGGSKPTIYRWMKENKFPKPVRIGERAVGWLDSEINNWIQSRPRAEI